MGQAPGKKRKKVRKITFLSLALTPLPKIQPFLLPTPPTNLPQNPLQPPQTMTKPAPVPQNSPQPSQTFPKLQPTKRKPVCRARQLSWYSDNLRAMLQSNLAHFLIWITLLLGRQVIRVAKRHDVDFVIGFCRKMQASLSKSATFNCRFQSQPLPYLPNRLCSTTSPP